MSNKTPYIIMRDLEFNDDLLEVRGYKNHITIESNEYYDEYNDIRANIRITHEDARKLVDFLNKVLEE